MPSFSESLSSLFFWNLLNHRSASITNSTAFASIHTLLEFQESERLTFPLVKYLISPFTMYSGPMLWWPLLLMGPTAWFDSTQSFHHPIVGLCNQPSIYYHWQWIVMLGLLTHAPSIGTLVPRSSICGPHQDRWIRKLVHESIVLFMAFVTTCPCDAIPGTFGCLQ